MEKTFKQSFRDLFRKAGSYVSNTLSPEYKMTTRRYCKNISSHIVVSKSYVHYEALRLKSGLYEVTAYFDEMREVEDEDKPLRSQRGDQLENLDGNKYFTREQALIALENAEKVLQQQGWTLDESQPYKVIYFSKKKKPAL